ncbi:MAG: hypothetical protein ACYSWQ_07815 [Planctomycetota bacterium]|jgi:hypothetical protein
METDGQKRAPSSLLPVVVSVALVAAAIFLSRSPLESSRPEVPARPRHARAEDGNVEARLWQDPFLAALDHEESEHGGGKTADSNSIWACGSRHDVDQVTHKMGRLIGETNADPNVTTVQVLLTIVRDGTFAEDHERRLRNRYAMLTALVASGLAPEDSEHIEYFRLPWSENDELDWGVKNNEVPPIYDISDRISEIIIVPFEWFKRTEPYVKANSDSLVDSCPERVVVAWLPESAFSHRPLTRLAQLIHAIGHKPNCNVRIDVIGPSYSGTLAAMIEEISSIDHNSVHSLDVRSMLDGLAIFSPWSTASPALLVKDWVCPPTNKYSESSLYGVIPNRFEEIGVQFIRMIGSDDLLAKSLIGELNRRGLNLFNEKSRVDLISEWDTFYGKTFPLTFATMVECIKNSVDDDFNWRAYAESLNRKMDDRRPSWPANIGTYSYMRGVDGKLPGSDLPTDTAAGKRDESASQWTYSENLELPISRGQLDYVRRLAQMLDADHSAESGKPQRSRPKAIGVVGSDVYDKLTLLHALREQFDNLVLFTTDLDARLMHCDQSKWTRNVIVASNFGLELADYYQQAVYQQKGGGGILPFRDNYQTALFFACRTALGLCEKPSEYEEDQKKPRKVLRDHPNTIRELLMSPRLFEIGHSRAVDLSVHEGRVMIHPQRDNLIVDRQSLGPMLLKAVLSLTAIACCFLLLANISQTVGRGAVTRVKRWDATGIISKATMLLVIVFVVVVAVDHHRAEGEPFSLVAGVSIWPGEALRLIAAILSVCFIVLSLKALRKSEKELSKDFKIDQPDRSPSISLDRFCKNERIQRRWTNVLWLRWRYYKECISTLFWSIERKDAEAKLLWPNCLFRGQRPNRFLRAILLAFPYVMLVFILMSIFGTPYTPHRGKVSLCVNRILLVMSVAPMVFLMFLVVDATHLCIRVVNAIIKYPNWAEELTDEFAEGTSILTKDAECWFDVWFIAKFTEEVGKLIYFPFIILSIMVLARIQYFDNWDFPLSLVITLLVYFFHALGCAIALQIAARKARRTALGELQETLSESKLKNQRRAMQTEYLIEEIKSVRQGAFRPFLENPVVHILIPSGGLSMLTLLRLFA